MKTKLSGSLRNLLACLLACGVIPSQMAHADVEGIDAGGRKDLSRSCLTDAKDVGQADLDPLVAGQVYASNTCHIVVLPPLKFW